jgi:hypothetical protein
MTRKPPDGRLFVPAFVASKRFASTSNSGVNEQVWDRVNAADEH